MIDAVQTASIQSYLGLIAGCWLGIYVFYAACLVFIALGLVWTAKRLFKRKLGWAPLSSIDLPIGTVGVLIAGVLLIAVSNIAGVPDMVRLAGCNVLIIAAIPVCVQGVAACKGVMNRAKFPTVAQVVVTAVLLVFGLLLPVVLIAGVVDFWANIRRLPREGGEDEARTYM